MKKYLIPFLLAPSLTFGAANYRLTITNGSEMPISPGVIYVATMPLVNIGAQPIPGFTQLCQFGDPELRYDEIMGSENVKSVELTDGPILPGESITVSVKLKNPLKETIYYEAMYAKTKDVCAVAAIPGKALELGKQNFNDRTIASGAFTDPMLRDLKACDDESSAVDCLRVLSMERMGTIRNFPGYLPSVLNFLETKYSSHEVKELVFPTSGAVSITVD